MAPAREAARAVLGWDLFQLGSLMGEPGTTHRAVFRLDTTDQLIEIFRRLLRQFGPQGWWPARTDFEMAVGAILTQSTSWANVEKAIANLEAAGALDNGTLERLPLGILEELIRPSGYYRVKARKLKAFAGHLTNAHGGSLARLFHVKLPELRTELLGIWGIGPETADSIILYGARKPVFVVDAYTRRVFSRLEIVGPTASYEDLQAIFHAALTPDVELYQEYHALIVAHGKLICRPTPRCHACPLLDRCPTGVRRVSDETSKAEKEPPDRDQAST